MKFEEWLSQQDGIIEVDCGCVTTEAFYHWMRVAYEAGSADAGPRSELVSHLSRICAESYQVVGALSEALNIFNDIGVIKALDNLSAQELIHNDVLPFSVPEAGKPAPVVLQNLRTIVADPRRLPRRKEWIGGQQYSYVLLEEVEALVEDACRATMLQDAEPVTKEYGLPEGFDFDHFNDPVWFEAIIGLDNMYDPVTRTLATVALGLNRKLDKPELAVWYGSMPETNGKTNWTAILHRKGECLSTGITVDRSEYPDRVRYEADRMRYLIGDLADEPDILAYDADAHSGYVPPSAPQEDKHG